MIIIIDCDGALTDGKVLYGSGGVRQKQFHSRDITSLKRLVRAGHHVHILTQSSWQGLKHFAKRTGAKYHTGIIDKKEWIRREIGLQPFIAVCDDYDDVQMCMVADRVYYPKDAGIRFINAMNDHPCAVMINRSGGDGIIEEIEILL